MTRQIYSAIESLNRLLRLFKGETPREEVDSLVPPVLSSNLAISDLAELVANSLPDETLTLPSAFSTAIGNAGFATGTAVHLDVYTGSSVALSTPSIIEFTSGIDTVISGTSVFLSAGNAHNAYKSTVLGVQSANLIAYWPMDELTGTNADNAEGTAARDGTFAGVTLDAADGPFTGGRVGSWDGTNDYTNIYSTSLNTAISFSAATVSIWIKMSAAAQWDDTNWKPFINIQQVGSKHQYFIGKSGTANQVLFRTRVNNTQSDITKNSVTAAGWVHVAMTFNASADRMRAYWNGSQEGTDQTNTGEPDSPSLQSTGCVVGAISTTALFFPGNIAHAAIWSTELTAANVTTLYNGGPS